MSLEILQAGPLTTVQDGGRLDWRAHGVSCCGAVDDLALTWGNALVGNHPLSAGLEFTLSGARVRFGVDAHIAITGTDMPAHLDGHPLQPWWRHPVRAGQTLQLAAPRERMRTMLLVQGGIDVPQVLGSRATDLKAGWGGLEGRALRHGDRLALLPPQRPSSPLERRLGVRPPDWSASVRVLRGPEYATFPAAACELLWEQAWTVTPQSNRMGYRLAGPRLQRQVGSELASHGVLPGVIQVPPSGQPIVLLADAQTTGGYPKIGVVIQADLWKLAQVRLGGQLRFKPVSLDEARSAWRHRQQALTTLQYALHDR